jgi:hypothetical protein
VGILGLFVKLALQTNQKLGLKSMQWVLLRHLSPILDLEPREKSPILQLTDVHLNSGGGDWGNSDFPTTNQCVCTVI